MSSSIELSLKSTLDKLIFDLATANRIGYVDLDGMVTMSEIYASEEAALGWTLETLVNDPKPPMYSVTFIVGGKLTNDPAQYAMMDLMNVIANPFHVGNSIDIYDYSAVPEEEDEEDGKEETEETPKRVGELLISHVGVQNALTDGVHNFRPVSIHGRLVEF